MRSEELYKRALKLFPGGVNSPVRAFSPYPFFVRKAKGSKIVSIDNIRYTDYCMSYGAMLFGHAHPPLVDVVHESIKNGSLFGAPSEKEVELAELISKCIPSMEMMRFVNSGAEATMHAIRVARGYTNRMKVVKFEGCYHGAYDSMLVKAGSGATTFGIPNSLGVPEETVKDTIVLPYNNFEKLESVIKRRADEIAGMIIEPVIGNAGLIIPKDGYLQKLRKISRDYGILLIFDEVITGFRLAFGGAQEYFGIEADVVTYGKVVGGGLPFAIFGGRRDIMENLVPKGKVYQAGTYSGNPLSVSTALYVVRELRRRSNSIYSKLHRDCRTISRALREIVEKEEIDASVNSIASMFQIFFTKNDVVDYASALTCDTAVFKKYFDSLLSSKIFVPPSQFETCFLSLAHTKEDVNRAIEAFNEAV